MHERIPLVLILDHVAPFAPQKSVTADVRSYSAINMPFLRR